MAFLTNFISRILKKTYLWLSIILLFSHGFITYLSASKIASIKLHDIKFNNLSRLDESTVLSVKHILSTIGILKISGIPNLNQAQKDAFDSLSSCLLLSTTEEKNNNLNGNNNNFNKKNSQEQQIFTTIMNDGTKRLTIGIKSDNPNKSQPLNNIRVGHQQKKIVHDCGKPSSSLRALVDVGTRQVFLALDLAYTLSNTTLATGISSIVTNIDTNVSSSDTTVSTSSTANSININSNNHPIDGDNDDHYLMKPYQSFEELVDNGVHLEHIHTYYNTKSKSSTSKSNINNSQELSLLPTSDSHSLDAIITTATSIPTMSMHTDAGLLIAMTSGYYSSSSSSTEYSTPQRGLFITLSTGEIVHVDEADLSTNDLIIMVGAGGADWLSPRGSQPLRAVPHALVVELGSDTTATRNWYGKMFLPPLDAELYQSSSLPITKRKADVFETYSPSSSTSDDDKRGNKDVKEEDTHISQAAWTYKAYRDDALKLAMSSSSSSSSSISSMSLDDNNGINSNKMNQLPAACGESIGISSVLRSSLSSSSSAVQSLLAVAIVTVPVSCTVSSSGEIGVMCWKQCMSATALHCSSGTSPVCTDTLTLQPVDGSSMCPSTGGMKACKLTCLPPTSSTLIPFTTFLPSVQPTNLPTLKPIISHDFNSNNNNNNQKSLFCLTPGSGTSMSMTGFMFSSSDTGRQSECFVYLFPSWSLDTPFKFFLGCLFTILLGVGIHGLSKLKLSIQYFQTPIKIKFYLSIFIYFVQIMLSYIVMLIAMTYNAELFMMVCIGLTIGYALFHPHPYKEYDRDDNHDREHTTTNNHHIVNNKNNQYNHIQPIDNDNDSEHDSITSNSNMTSSLLPSFMQSSSSSISPSNKKRSHQNNHSHNTTTSNNNNNSNIHINTHLEPCCQDLDYESLTIIVKNNNPPPPHREQTTHMAVNHTSNNDVLQNSNGNRSGLNSSNNSSKSDSSATTHIIKRRNL